MAVAVSAAATGTEPAGAQSGPSVGIDPTYGPPLTNVKVSGSGFCGPPCGSVAIRVGTLFVASGVAVSSNGTFSAVIHMPGTVRPGTVAISASQTDRTGGTISAQTDFTVTVGTTAPTSYTTVTTAQPPTGSPPTTARPGGSPTTAPGGPTTAPPGSTSAPSSGATTTGSGATTTGSGPTSTGAPGVTGPGGEAAARRTNGHGHSSSWPVVVAVLALAAVAVAGGVGALLHRRRARGTP